MESYILDDKSYRLYPNILINDTIHYLPTKKNDSDNISFITDNRCKNYDLYTIYLCLKARKSIYIKKILYDTFNYYCSLLSGSALSLYLYSNIAMFNKSYSIISQNDVLSTDKHEQLKLDIITLINQLPHEDTILNTKFIIYPV